MYLKVLIVEDSEDDAILLANYLKSCGFDPKWQRVDCEADLAEAVEDRRWDLVLCDLSMPRLTPVMAVNCVRQVNPDIPIIIVTGAVAEDVAISLIQHGVQDVVLKDDLPRLKTAHPPRADPRAKSPREGSSRAAARCGDRKSLPGRRPL